MSPNVPSKPSAQCLPATQTPAVACCDFAHQFAQKRRVEAYRFWPGLVYRWAFALAFALFAVWTSSAGWAWMNRDRDSEIAALQSRLALLDVIEHRAATLPVRDQQHIRRLLDWPPALTTTSEPARRPTD
jgi:hypothetical protein